MSFNTKAIGSYFVSSSFPHDPSVFSLFVPHATVSPIASTFHHSYAAAPYTQNIANQLEVSLYFDYTQHTCNDILLCTHCTTQRRNHKQTFYRRGPPKYFRSFSVSFVCIYQAFARLKYRNEDVLYSVNRYHMSR